MQLGKPSGLSEQVQEGKKIEWDESSWNSDLERELWIRQLKPEESQEIHINICIGEDTTKNKKFLSSKLVLINPFFSDFDSVGMN